MEAMPTPDFAVPYAAPMHENTSLGLFLASLLYTSDAADEEISVLHLCPPLRKHNHTPLLSL